MIDRSILAGVISGVFRLAAFAIVAGAIFAGAVSLAESGGSAALFVYAVGLPLLGGLVGIVVVVLEDRADARRAAPRMITLRPGGRR